MGKYAREADNTAKSCKSRGSHLRVHFKVNFICSRKKNKKKILKNSGVGHTRESCVQCVYSGSMLTSKIVSSDFDQKLIFILCLVPVQLMNFKRKPSSNFDHNL